MNKQIFVTLTFSIALSLASCASGKNTKTQKQAKCDHLEICHGNHHHHNSRHHHEGRQGGTSEQNEAEQAPG